MTSSAPRRASCAVALLACAACTAAPAPAPHKAVLRAAPPGDVAALVQAQVQASAAAHRRALVYVGAPWCEPCRRFHDAVAAGALDAVVGDVDFLVFDLDVDRERLDAAGYGSQMIPLLAVPGPDGRGTDARMEGSIKGAGAVAEMTPRLRALLRR